MSSCSSFRLAKLMETFTVFGAAWLWRVSYHQEPIPATQFCSSALWLGCGELQGGAPWGDIHTGMLRSGSIPGHWISVSYSVKLLESSVAWVWRRSSSALWKDSWIQLKSWPEPEAVLSSQFGCGHPDMETQILKVWIWVIPYPLTTRLEKSPKHI